MCHCTEVLQDHLPELWQNKWFLSDNNVHLHIIAVVKDIMEAADTEILLHSYCSHSLASFDFQFPTKLKSKLKGHRLSPNMNLKAVVTMELQCMSVNHMRGHMMQGYKGHSKSFWCEALPVVIHYLHFFPLGKYRCHWWRMEWMVEAKLQSILIPLHDRSLHSTLKKIIEAFHHRQINWKFSIQDTCFSRKKKRMVTNISNGSP